MEAQRKVESENLTKRNAAGMTGRLDQWKADMTMQTALQGNILKIRERLAALTDAADSDMVIALNTTLTQELARLRQLEMRTGRRSNIAGVPGSFTKHG
jgi:hypothetical protein